MNFARRLNAGDIRAKGKTAAVLLFRAYPNNNLIDFWLGTEKLEA